MSHSLTKTAALTAIVPLSEDGRIYTSLDGLQVSLSDWQMDYIRHIQGRGYTTLIPAKGTFGCSELCMHMRVWMCQVIAAWVNDRKTYAYVIYIDREGNPRITDGCYFRYGDGDISLS